jgi:hypothetical protein
MATKNEKILQEIAEYEMLISDKSVPADEKEFAREQVAELKAKLSSETPAKATAKAPAKPSFKTKKPVSKEVKEKVEKRKMEKRGAISDMSKTEFNAYLKKLSERPEYAFLKQYNYTKNEVVADMKRASKPIGWRFKGKSLAHPTASQIKSAKEGKRDDIYQENRPNHGDASPKAKFGKGGSTEIAFENSNLYLHGFGMDTNGNSVVKVGFPNQRAFSIQTNGVLPKTHSLKGSKLSELSSGDIASIEKEVVAYVKEHGSMAQKKSLKTYSGMMADGGGVENLKVGDFIVKKGSKIELEVKEVGNDWRSGKDYITIYNDVTNSTTTLVDWSNYEKVKLAKGGGLGSKSKYVPNRMITEISVERKGKETIIDGADVLDGMYVKKGTKFADGGGVNNEQITLVNGNGKKYSVGMPKIYIAERYINEVALSHILENTGLEFEKSGNGYMYEAQPTSSNQIVALLLTYNFKTKYMNSSLNKNTLVLYFNNERMEEGGMMARGGGLGSKSKYIPNRMITEVSVERNGRETIIDGADIFDGFYAKKGVKFADGGSTDDTFTYMMLGRLIADNDYYLGYGNRSERNLWAGNVDDQIDEMKKLWNKLPADGKPEWLSMQDILNYEEQMKENKFSHGGGVKKEKYLISFEDSNGYEIEKVVTKEELKLMTGVIDYTIVKKFAHGGIPEMDMDDDGVTRGFFDDEPYNYENGGGLRPIY